MAKLWFKARRYGWGWTPASLEGWIVLFLFLALNLAGTIVFLRQVLGGAKVGMATALFVLWTVFLGAALTAIAWATGERPRWRWG